MSERSTESAESGAARKLIVQQWVTVDNVAAEEDGGLSFVAAVPFDDTITDDPFQNAMMGFIDTVDTMILGANTYAQSKDYWPYAEDQGNWARKLNNLSKFVASTQLQAAPWGSFAAATVTADPAATIRELKSQNGKNLWLWGSLTLMHHLLAVGLVDELRLLVCPVSRGRGTRVFQDVQVLQLIEATGYANGLAIQRYAVKTQAHAVPDRGHG